MFVSAEEMLKKAVAGHYAVGQFNINNLNGQKKFCWRRRSKISGYPWCF